MSRSHTPTRPGPLQIAANAVYQGKTAALTYTQTNLTTAAEATAASGAAGGAATLGALATTAARGASTAAGAAMGGALPPTAIAVAGATVAVGTYIVPKLTGNDPQEAVCSGTFASQFTVQTVQPSGLAWLRRHEYQRWTAS